MNVIQFVKYLCQDALDNYSIDEVLAAIGKAALEAYQEEFGDEDD